MYVECVCVCVCVCVHDKKVCVKKCVVFMLLCVGSVENNQTLGEQLDMNLVSILHLVVQ